MCVSFDGVKAIVKAHTHQALHDRTDHTFDRLAIGIRLWNVYVLCGLVVQLALQLADCSADSY